MNPRPKPSKRFSCYVRKITCGEWEALGPSGAGGHSAILRHTSGATVSYALHDGGNDLNAPRNFAAEVQRICGCKLIEPRGRKRGRQKPQREDPQVAASRRRHAAELERRDALRQAEAQEAAETAAKEAAWRASCRRIEEADRARAEILALMG